MNDVVELLVKWGPPVERISSHGRTENPRGNRKSRRRSPSTYSRRCAPPRHHRRACPPRSNKACRSANANPVRAELRTRAAIERVAVGHPRPTADADLARERAPHRCDRRAGCAVHKSGSVRGAPSDRGLYSAHKNNRPPITRVYDVLANYVNSHLIASYARPVGPVSTSLELALSTPDAPPPTPEQIAAVAAAAAAKASLPSLREHRETGGPTTTSPGAAPPKKASVLGWFGLMAAAILVSALGVGGYFAWRLMNVKPPETAVAGPSTTEAKTAEASSVPTVEVASATAVATTASAVETTSADVSTTVATTRTGKLPVATSVATTAETTATITTPPVATTVTATTSSPSAKSTGLTMPFDPNKKN